MHHENAPSFSSTIKTYPRMIARQVGSHRIGHCSVGRLHQYRLHFGTGDGHDHRRHLGFLAFKNVQARTHVYSAALFLFFFWLLSWYLCRAVSKIKTFFNFKLFCPSPSASPIWTFLEVQLAQVLRLGLSKGTKWVATKRKPRMPLWALIWAPRVRGLPLPFVSFFSQ